MAFFGLTQLGYQNPIREHVSSPGITPQHVFNSGMYRDPPYRREEASEASKATECSEKPLFTPGYAGKDVSYVDLKSRIEFQKYQHEPTEVYRRPVVSSEEIGAWKRDEPIGEKEPWTRVERHPLIRSELTRFVDEMGRTDKQFQLF